MEQQPLVSICIPTNNRVDIVRETVKSLLAQGADKNLYEICISDNSKTDETKILLENEFSSVSNLRYGKSDCVGFFNSIEALKLGRGKLLKLHNDYSKFKPGALSQIIEVVRKYSESENVIFFAMESIKAPRVITEYYNFNDFLNFISYMSTWSSAFSIWKKDLDFLTAKKIKLDHMFPHTSLLFALTNKPKYIVDNHEYVVNLPLKKKGGYNLVDNFVRLYLTMVKNLLQDGSITTATYRKIEHGIIKFCASWYVIVKTNHNFTFTFDNKEQLIFDCCGRGALWQFLSYIYIYYFPKAILKKIIKGHY